MKRTILGSLALLFSVGASAWAHAAPAADPRGESDLIRLTLLIAGLSFAYLIYFHIREAEDQHGRRRPPAEIER